MNNSTSSPSRPLRVIAITGCDGSGKSTLTHRLVQTLSLRTSVEEIYLGQSSGFIKQKITELPLVGEKIAAYLVSKSDKVHEKPNAPPGNLEGTVIFLLSCWRAYKFKRLLRREQKGVLLVTDRYPQAEVPGFRVDGPHLGKAQGGSRWIQILRRHEQRLYNWMASYPPALLIRLSVDEQTAFARKPDHDIASLREKIRVIPTLTFNGAHILELSGTDPEDEVFSAALAAINKTFDLP
ncbi:hypothetical protein [Rosenbergiella australiborealis]|uniref:hypothetical protein n=1 Tax=Rosenbergiella australiborealis TaxID=1544696 RepID=UPI001F4F0ADB